MYPLGFDNPWIAASDGTRRRLPAWLAAIVGLVVPLLCVEGGGWIATRLTPVWTPSSPVSAALWRTAVLYVVVLAPLLAIGAVLRTLIERCGRPAGWRFGRGAGLGLGIGIVGFAVLAGLLTTFGALQTGSGGPTGSAAIAGVMVGLALIGLQTGAEEVFFRGWLQPNLCARWGVWAGLLATSVLFAAAHLARSRWGWIASANLVLGGLLFGVLALRTGGLWAPFGAHFAWNWLESAGLGLDPNPGLGPFGAVVDLDAVGQGLITGGRDGLDGSLLSTLVLALLILGLVAVGARRGGPVSGVSRSVRPAGYRSGRVRP